MDKYTIKLKQEIQKYLNNEDIFFYFKGRVSLYTILKAMGVGPGDEVIIPAYTCVVVPNPIIYLGAKPIYIEINEDTYNINLDELEKNITSKTKVIVSQNTYGLSSNVEEIISIAKKHNLYTIEDCTHGFGGTYNDKPNGSYCDAAFYSMQWNKPFSSGVGGFCAINNKSLLGAIKELDKEKLEPSLFTKLNLKLLYFTKRYILNNFTYWIMVSFYRWLSKHNLVTGSSSGNEISDSIIPHNFFMSYSSVQAKEGLRNINGLNKTLELRVENAKLYTNFLQENKKTYISKKLFKNHSFLKYPILVENREKFNLLAQKSKIELGDWFNSPIHPVQEKFDKWHFTPENFPKAVYASAHVVNIPTDTTNSKRVIDFLKKYLEELI
jgi:dTDP-4-amino-4,6-dideoxygalactose transaminase